MSRQELAPPDKVDELKSNLNRYLRSELRIPRAHIKSARQDAAAAAGWAGLRAGGTHVPGLITAGTFYLDGLFGHKPTFFDVQHKENTVVVELTDEHYARLIIEVEDPAAVVALLNGLATAPA